MSYKRIIACSVVGRKQGPSTALAFVAIALVQQIAVEVENVAGIQDDVINGKMF